LSAKKRDSERKKPPKLRKKKRLPCFYEASRKERESPKRAGEKMSDASRGIDKQRRLFFVGGKGGRRSGKKGNMNVVQPKGGPVAAKKTLIEILHRRK